MTQSKLKAKLSRRDFIKVAGITTVLAFPTLIGYKTFRDSEGVIPPVLDAYGGSNQEWNQSKNSIPLLLLTNDITTKSFASYLGELLKTEGINCFGVARFSEINSNDWERIDQILLSEGSLNNDQVELLANFVSRGGNLVTMRPDSKLLPILGLEQLSGEIEDGFFRIDTKQSIASGISTEALQFHGPANMYRLTSAQAVAWLSQTPDESNQFPAVTINEYGKGMAAMWAFDLARSVAYTRQGNPSWANQERDDFNGIRTADMFAGWIDLNRIAIPQADEQQRLLINLLNFMSQSKGPLPRLWYFPNGADGMLIATGDSHMNPSLYVEQTLKIVEKYGGHFTIFYTPQLLNSFGRAARRVRFWVKDNLRVIDGLLGDEYSSPTPGLIANWRSRGHEFTLHPYVEQGVEQGWNRYWQEFTGKGYGPVSPTARTHRILWSGWTETARIQAEHGIRMNFDYYHVGPSMKTRSGDWVNGYLTGSGLPMKFVDEDGRVLNIYQQLTQIADEHLLSMDVPGWGGWPNLSPGEAAEVYKTLINNSIDHGYYAAITAQFHVDPFQVGGEAAEKAAQFLEGTLAYAAMRNIPIWSAVEWLDFTELRHNTIIEKLIWEPDARKLSFGVKSNPATKALLTIMLPMFHQEGVLDRVFVDGTLTTTQERKVGGIKYVYFSIQADSHLIEAGYV